MAWARRWSPPCSAIRAWPAIPRWTLVTSDAHGLYAGFGFVLISNPEKQMIRQR